MPNSTIPALRKASRKPITSLRQWTRNVRWRHIGLQLLDKCSGGSFDFLHGTDTELQAELAPLRIESINKKYGERYQASPVYSLRKILRRLDIDFSATTFVDFGSGKGRTLLIASELPFRRVIGVEFSPALHACALRNVARYGLRKASSVEPLLCDASTFALPREDLVLYFFNPFTDVLLTSVMQNIDASLRRHPRRVIVVYLYLASPDLIDSFPHLRLRERWYRYHIFDSTQADR